MSLSVLAGHEETRAALARAAAAGRLPGSILLHGPAGIGRQRLGLWLAQLLMCERTGAEAEPCDACRACRLVQRLEHPDLHWFFPVARPKGASGERLMEALEDVRAAELETRRQAPLRPPAPGELVGFYMAQVQTIRRLASTRPSMGRVQVFLIGDAELLVPQEASQEAANALLKVLEEPPEATVFILTAADPDALLPTIRSRLLPVRLRPLPEAKVAAYLVEHAHAAEDAAALAARLGSGAIGRALGFLPGDGGETGPLEELRAAGRALLEAAAAPGAAPRLAAAHAASPAGARGAHRDTLDFLALWCRDLAAVAAGAPATVVNRDATAWLEKLAHRLPSAATGAARAVAAIEAARDLGSYNVNPQLVLATLLLRLRRELGAEADRPSPTGGAAALAAAIGAGP